jgi:hypothetical protein
MHGIDLRTFACCCSCACGVVINRLVIVGRDKKRSLPTDRHDAQSDVCSSYAGSRPVNGQDSTHAHRHAAACTQDENGLLAAAVGVGDGCISQCSSAAGGGKPLQTKLYACTHNNNLYDVRLSVFPGPLESNVKCIAGRSLVNSLVLPLDCAGGRY